MRKATEKKEYFYLECPKCSKKIKGNSKSHVEYNYKIHKEAKHNE